jgi:hypothetical protein
MAGLGFNRRFVSGAMRAVALISQLRCETSISLVLLVLLLLLQCYSRSYSFER